VINLRYLLQGLTTAIPGAAVEMPVAGSSENEPIDPDKAFMASVAGTGAVTASVNIEVTNDPTVGWIVLATLALTGTTLAFAGQLAKASWPWVRGNVTALTGTGAAVTLSMYP